MSDQLREKAIEEIKGYIANGWNLKMFLGSSPVSFEPGDPVTRIYVNTTVTMGDHSVKLKRHEMAVCFYYKDGRFESEIFDYRKLWREIENPQPVQLKLFDEVQS